MTTLGLVIVLLIIVLFVVLLWFFRLHLVTLSSEMTPEQALAAGYGYYTEPVAGDCVTSSTPARCTETGTQSEVRICVPHPETKRGCIDQNGQQTFATRVSEIQCVPLCRTSVWVDQRVSPCQPLLTPPYQQTTCYPADTVGTRTLTQRCAALDATGTNTCTYLRDYASREPIPQGCILDPIGTTVTCEVGTTVTLTETCAPFIENICGEWRLPDGQECLGSDVSLPESLCRGPTGNPYSSDTDLFSTGWTGIPLQCVDEQNPGKPTQCRPYPGCVPPEQAYEAMLMAGGAPVVICGTQPLCGRLCTYVPTSIQGDWDPRLKVLVGSFQLMIRTEGDQTYGLGLNNVPCPQFPQGRFLVDGFIPTTSPLSDCFGDPLRPLTNTPFMWFNASAIAAQPTTYNLSATCTTDSILRMTGFYMTFRPTRPMSRPDTLYCNIIGVLGKNYAGWLTQDGTSLRWVQSNLESVFTRPNTTNLTEFTVTLTSSGTFNILAVGGGPASVPTPLGQTFGLNNVSCIQRLASADALFTVLNERQTRWNPASCNAMYLYPPPAGYPYPDVTADPVAKKLG